MLPRHETTIRFYRAGSSEVGGPSAVGLLRSTSSRLDGWDRTTDLRFRKPAPCPLGHVERMIGEGYLVNDHSRSREGVEDLPRVYVPPRRSSAHGTGRTCSLFVRSEVLDPSSCVGLRGQCSPDLGRSWSLPLRRIGESNPCSRLDKPVSVPLDQCSVCGGLAVRSPLPTWASDQHAGVGHRPCGCWLPRCPKDDEGMRSTRRSRGPRASLASVGHPLRAPPRARTWFSGVRARGLTC